MATALVLTMVAPAAQAEDWSQPRRLEDSGYRSQDDLAVEAAGRRAVLEYIRGRGAFNGSQVVVRRSRGPAAWGDAKVLGRGRSQDTAINAPGQVLSTWIGSDGVAVRLGRVDGSWARPVVFRSRGVRGERYWVEPQVELSDSGAAVVLWTVGTQPHQGLGEHTWVRAAYRSPQGRWRAPVTIAHVGRFFADADAGIGRRGDVMVTYRKGERVVVRSRPVGDGWRGARTVGTVHPRRVAVDPQLEQTQSGDTVVVHWQTAHRLLAVRRDRGRWGQTRQLNDRRLEPSVLYQEDNVAVDEAGRVTAAWAREDLAIVAATWARPRGPLTREVIGERPRNPRFSPSALELEANRRGDVVVSWAHARPRPQVLRSVYRRAGHDWGSPQRVAAHDDLYYVDAAVRATGAVDLVWEAFVDATPPTVEWYSRRPAP